MKPQLSFKILIATTKCKIISIPIIVDFINDSFIFWVGFWQLLSVIASIVLSERVSQFAYQKPK